MVARGSVKWFGTSERPFVPAAESYISALIEDIEVETTPAAAPLLDAVEEIRQGNIDRNVSQDLMSELSARAINAMAIRSAELSAS